jgi:hypothetical protein
VEDAASETESYALKIDSTYSVIGYTIKSAIKVITPHNKKKMVTYQLHDTTDKEL